MAGVAVGFVGSGTVVSDDMEQSMYVAPYSLFRLDNNHDTYMYYSLWRHKIHYILVFDSTGH